MRPLFAVAKRDEDGARARGAVARELLKATGEDWPMPPNEKDRTPTMAWRAPSREAREPSLLVLAGRRVGNAYLLTKPALIVGRQTSARTAMRDIANRTVQFPPLIA